MKRILLIATGGTIASRPTEDGLKPEISTDEILSYVPEIKDVAEVSCIQLFNIDSTNLYYKHWLAITECIKNNYDEYDGFVVTHGTDTMAYTASAISYLVQNSKKPIVFTGSQKSIYMKDTDARNNLYNAFLYACSPYACLVHIVFEGKIIIGNRARKTRTKSYNAFSSVDFPEVGVIRDGRIIMYITEYVEKFYPDFYFDLDHKVFVYKIIPGDDFSALRLIKDKFDALVLESFGAGNLPLYENNALVKYLRDWTTSGKTVVVTTQVPYEGSDMCVYETGRTFKNETGIIEAYDMTLESVVSKLMWILAITREQKEVEELFYKPVQKDII